MSEAPAPVGLEALAKAAMKPIPPAQCPYCGREEASTHIGWLPKRQSFGGGATYTFGACRDCGEVCGLNVTMVSLEGDLAVTAYTFPRPLFAPIMPKQKPATSGEVAVPPHLPPSVESPFKQARHNLVLGNWDSAGMAYRKTLEMALGEKFGLWNGNLKSRVERASESERSPFALFGWFTRHDGNKAAHREGIGMAAALIMDSCVEQLMVHLFTVPGLKTGVALTGTRAC